MKEIKKRVVYVGPPSPDGVLMGDVGGDFVAHGMKFEKRVVQPVSDHVYEWAVHQRGFVPIDRVATTVLDFPPKADSYGMGSAMPEMQPSSGLVTTG